MRFDLNSWEEIFITLARNKSRTLLTAFGVFWGIFMLILLLGGGNGLKAVMSKNFDGVDQNTAIVGTNRTSVAYKGFQKGRYWNLEMKDVALISAIDGVEKVSPMISRWGVKANYQAQTTNASIIGTTPTYDKLEKQELLYGRFINDIDVAEARKVVILGKKLYDELFKGTGDPTGTSVEIQGVYYSVIGIKKDASSAMNFGADPASTFYMPISTVQKLYNRGNKIDYVMIGGSKGRSMASLQENIESTIKAANMIAPTDKQGVFFVNAEAMYKMISSLMLGINILIWLVGLGTLLAGIIGVSNIMMVTVKERTTEFGIRRAIGALPRDVLGQVLLESIVITIISGVFGLFLAVLALSGVEKIVNQMNDSNVGFQVSFAIAMGTLAILILLGVFAGLAPAYRALSIKPIDAIREE